jgi:hypothetical protein
MLRGQPMNIAVDTSVIIAVIANEPERATLVELTKGADLIAPLSVHYFFGPQLGQFCRADED